jgi:alkylhydroperoxidase family enzyme
VTLIAKNHPTEDQVKNMLKHFSQKELADLTLAIISINGWNRLNISFRNEPELCPVD